MFHRFGSCFSDQNRNRLIQIAFIDFKTKFSITIATVTRLNDFQHRHFPPPAQHSSNQTSLSSLERDPKTTPNLDNTHTHTHTPSHDQNVPNNQASIRFSWPCFNSRQCHSGPNRAYNYGDSAFGGIQRGASRRRENGRFSRKFKSPLGFPGSSVSSVSARVCRSGNCLVFAER